MQTRHLMFVFAAIAGTAAAQSAPESQIRASAPEQFNTKGMIEISDGLFAYDNGETQSFVAYGRHGNEALLDRLTKYRAEQSESALSLNRDSKYWVIDDLIVRLSAPEPKSGEVYGDCAGPHAGTTWPFHAKALAGGIIGPSQYGSSASAANTNATISTTNVANASATDINGYSQGDQTTTTFGTTTAYAHVFVDQYAGCDANSSATVTCPNATRPAITATALNHKQSCIRH